MSKPQIEVPYPVTLDIGSRETLKRFVKSLRRILHELAACYRATREEIALHRGLSGLDRRLRRDLGIDRDSA